MAAPIQVIDYVTITKAASWWVAVVFAEAMNKKQIGVYLWQKKKDGKWNFRKNEIEPWGMKKNKKY